MYYFIKPDNLFKPVKTPVKLLTDKQFRVSPLQSADVLEYYYSENKTWIPLGIIQFFYKVENDELVVDYCLLELTYKLPAYLDKTVLFNKVLSRFYQLLGDFTVYDAYADKSLQCKNRNQMEANSDFLEITYKEGFSEKLELLKYADKQKAKEVIKKFRAINPAMATIMYSIYISRLKSSQLLTEAEADLVAAEVVNIIKKLKEKQLRSILLFKYMLFYKGYALSLIADQSAQLNLQKYIPLLLTLDIKQETTQILYFDLLAYNYLSNYNHEKYSDYTAEFYKQVKQSRAIFIPWPETEVCRIIAQTGNHYKAVKRYFSLAMGKSFLNQLRKQYEAAQAAPSLIQGGKNHINSLIEKNLNLGQKMMIKPMQLISQGFYKKPGFLIPLVVVILTILRIVTILGQSYWLSHSSQIKFYYNGLDADAWFATIIISLLIYFFIMMMVLALVQTIKQLKDKTMTDRGKVVSIVLMPLLFLLLLMAPYFDFKTVTQGIVRSDLVAVGEKKLYLAFKEYNLSDIKKAVFRLGPCTTDKCNYSVAVVELILQDGKTTYMDFKDIGRGIKNYQGECQFLVDLQRYLEQSGVEVELTDQYNFLLSKRCQ